MKNFRIYLLAIILFPIGLFGNNSSGIKFLVKTIAELPAESGQIRNPGIAGAYSGIIGDKLIIAGGANFPDKKLWEGGTKVFHDRIYIYTIADTSLTLIDQIGLLPLNLAYGASVSIPDGLLVMGGNDSEQCFRSVNLLKLDRSKDYIEIIPYPELPVSISFASAVTLNNSVYLIGGSGFPDAKDTGAHFLKLDLSKQNSTDFKWEVLPSFPGAGRVFSVAVVQSDGNHPCIFLFGGRIKNLINEYEIFNNGLVYDPSIKKWDYLKSRFEFPIMAGSAFPLGNSEIVFVGGASGDSFMQQINQEKDFANAKTMHDTSIIKLSKEKLLAFYNEHPGFSKEIYIYNTITKESSYASHFDSYCPVTTHAVPYKGGVILTSGEIKPGIRTPEIILVLPSDQETKLGWLNSIGVFPKILGLAIGLLGGILLLRMIIRK